jgi:hypothetical protein
VGPVLAIGGSAVATGQRGKGLGWKRLAKGLYLVPLARLPYGRPVKCATIAHRMERFIAFEVVTSNCKRIDPHW